MTDNTCPRPHSPIEQPACSRSQSLPRESHAAIVTYYVTVELRRASFRASVVVVGRAASTSDSMDPESLSRNT